MTKVLYGLDRKDLILKQLWICSILLSQVSKSVIKRVYHMMSRCLNKISTAKVKKTNI